MSKFLKTPAATKKTCYMCDQPMTSSEHVPPKCIFPEQKDSGGVDYRKNMIVVPSCDLHNSAKSKEDEFFLLYMAANAYANDVGALHQNTKMARILERSPHVFAMLMATATPAVAKDAGGNLRETCNFHIDIDRFMGQFDYIARGIYFHHFSKKALQQVSVIPYQGLVAVNNEANVFVAKVRNTLKGVFDDLACHGFNPDVFYYQVARGLSGTLVLTTFFENLKVLFVYSSTDAPSGKT